MLFKYSWGSLGDPSWLGVLSDVNVSVGGVLVPSMLDTGSRVSTVICRFC